MLSLLGPPPPSRGGARAGRRRRVRRQLPSLKLLSRSFNGLDSPQAVEFSQRRPEKERARPGKIELSDMRGLDAAARRLISVWGAQLWAVSASLFPALEARVGRPRRR